MRETLTEKQSLNIIQETINKVKNQFSENGTMHPCDHDGDQFFPAAEIYTGVLEVQLYVHPALLRDAYFSFRDHPAISATGSRRYLLLGAGVRLRFYKFSLSPFIRIGSGNCGVDHSGI